MTRDIVTVEQIKVVFQADYERAYVLDNEGKYPKMYGAIYTGTWNTYAPKAYAVTTCGLSEELYADTLGDAVHAILGVYNSQ